MPSPNRPLSLAALTVIELAPPDIVTVAAKAGYDFAGLRLIPATPDEPSYPVVGDTPMVREIEWRLADGGIGLLDVEVFRLKPDTDVAAFQPVLETAARLGARHLLTTGQDTDMHRLADRFAALCDRAAPLGLTVDLEFMPWTEISSLELACELLGAVHHDNEGLVVDALHFDRTRARLDALAQVPKRWLHFMQLCDAPAERPQGNDALIREARTARRLPGEGALDLETLLRAMPATIPVSVEIPVATPGVPALERARAAAAAARRVMATAAG
jgi:sugar phosphate isomerase/epimerase